MGENNCTVSLFILTNVCNKVPRVEVWQRLRQTRAKWKDIKVIQDMYIKYEAVESVYGLGEGDGCIQS